MFSWAGYKTAYYLTDAASQTGDMDDRTVCFVMPEYPMELTTALCAQAEQTESVVCIMRPYDSRLRLKECRELIKNHKHTSVDNRGFLLLFFNPRQPKQHFKL